MAIPTSKDVSIKTQANGYLVTILGVPGKPAVFTDVQSLLANLTAYFNNPAVIPWTAPAAPAAAPVATAPPVVPPVVPAPAN